MFCAVCEKLAYGSLCFFLLFVFSMANFRSRLVPLTFVGSMWLLLEWHVLGKPRLWDTYFVTFGKWIKNHNGMFFFLFLTWRFLIDLIFKYLTLSLVFCANSVCFRAGLFCKSTHHPSIWAIRRLYPNKLAYYYKIVAFACFSRCFLTFSDGSCSLNMIHRSYLVFFRYAFRKFISWRGAICLLHDPSRFRHTVFHYYFNNFSSAFSLLVWLIVARCNFKLVWLQIF